MMGDPGLDAYRRARLDEARRDAGAVIAAARADAERLRHDAQAGAMRQTDAARETRSDALVRRARLQARERSRRIVLAAEGAAFAEIRAAVRERAMSLRDEPGYTDLLDRLSLLARHRLGDAATVERDPPEGGVRARLGTRSVDLTLPALADASVEALGEEVDLLWR